MKVLITAPSLDPNKNVSGISSVVSNIIDSSDTAEYAHFQLGRTDQKKRNLLWLLSQPLIPLFFLFTLISYRPRVLHLNTPLDGLGVTRDYFLSLLSRLLRIPILLHLHGGKYFSAPPRNATLARMIKKIISRADSVIVLSSSEKDWILNHFKADERKIEILPNFVKIPPFEEKPIKQISRIIFMGRIVASKGTEAIKSALSSLSTERSDFSFYLYGAGPELESIELCLSPLMTDRFKYNGIVTGKNKHQALMEADIFILPSQFEGLPLSLLEAMSYGIIPIVTNVGSIATAVEHNKNGFFIKKNDASDLKNKISHVLDILESNEGFNLKINAKLTIREKFGGKKYTEKLEKIYAAISKEQ